MGIRTLPLLVREKEKKIKDLTERGEKKEGVQYRGDLGGGVEGKKSYYLWDLGKEKMLLSDQSLRAREKEKERRSLFGTPLLSCPARGRSRPSPFRLWRRKKRQHALNETIKHYKREGGRWCTIHFLIVKKHRTGKCGKKGLLSPEKREKNSYHNACIAEGGGKKGGGKKKSFALFPLSALSTLGRRNAGKGEKVRTFFLCNRKEEEGGTGVKARLFHAGKGERGGRFRRL